MYHAEDTRLLMAGRPQTARSIIIRSKIIWQGRRRAVDEGLAWTDGARRERRLEGTGDVCGWGMMAWRHGKGMSDMAGS